MKSLLKKVWEEVSAVSSRERWLVAVFLAFGVMVYLFGSTCLEAENAVALYKNCAWWICLVWFGLLLFTLAREIKLACQKGGLLSAHRILTIFAGVVIVTAAGLFTLSREAAAFKIVADEPLLLSTAQEMHRTTQTGTIAKAHWIEGEYIVTTVNVDKRPPLYSFLVSLLHTMGAHSPEHGWHLNAALLFLLLGLIYAIGFRARGIWGGLLAVALAATIAQLSRSANSAGMELLNVTLIAALYLAAVAWLKERRTEHLSLVVLLAVGCALTRYESVLFVGYAGLVILAGWRQSKQVQLPLVAWLSPLMLLPYVLLDRVYEIGSDKFQTFLQGKENLPFSFGYLPENASAAWRHFTAMDYSQPNSPWLFWLAIALLVFTVLFWRRGEKVKDLALGMLAVVFGVWLVLVLSFNYGQFDATITQRLALPLWVFLIFCTAYCCRQFRTEWLTVLLGVVTIVFLAVFTVPQTKEHSYSASYHPTAGMQYVKDFAKANEGKPLLVVGDFPQIWTLYGVAATSIHSINDHPEVVANYMATFPDVPVLIFQRLRYDPEKQMLIAVDMNWPSERFKLTIVQERWVMPTALVRVSRIEAVEGVEPVSYRERIQELSVEEFSKLLP